MAEDMKKMREANERLQHRLEAVNRHRELVADMLVRSMDRKEIREENKILSMNIMLDH